MKHYFIFNPKAAKGRALAAIDNIRQDILDEGVDFEILIPSSAEDTITKTRDICKMASEENRTRIYSCGGDGTLNDVINGAYGFSNVEIGAMALGSGNDFIRSLGIKEDYNIVSKQIHGKALDIDLVKYSLDGGGKGREGICINILNIGFDADVAFLKDKYSKIPLIKGSLAYLVSIFVALKKKKTANIIVNTDVSTIYNDSLLLISFANGKYYGGGIKAAPLANINDGLLDIGIVKNLRRIKFLSLLPMYIKGEHINNKKTEDICYYHRASSINVVSRDDKFVVCVDGNILEARELQIDNIKSGLKFIKV